MVHKYTYTLTHTHTHTHTQTHTHTRTYSAGKCTKASTNMHSKQALSTIHEICLFLWILKAKELFVQASSGHTICADDFKAISCALRLLHATDTCQTLVYVLHGAHPLLRHSCHLSVATVLRILRRQPLIENDAGTKTAKMAHFPTKYSAHGWPEDGVAICTTCRSLLLRKNRLKCFAQYKCLHLQCLINTQPL